MAKYCIGCPVFVYVISYVSGEISTEEELCHNEQKRLESADIVYAEAVGKQVIEIPNRKNIINLRHCIFSLYQQVLKKDRKDVVINIHMLIQF